VSCVIAEDDVEEAVRRLHAVFDPPTTEMPT
jgi:aspartokinase